MSRCFPYPPPGHALSRASKDALIEPIKFQNGRVKSKEPKEKRREKEKSKVKKDKKNRNPGKYPLADGKFEPEQQFEGSNLTEEHGKPVCLRAPSTSYDSTETSNKRKKPSSPVDVNHGHVKKIIRIKLHPKKQIQADIFRSEQQQPCSTSKTTNVPWQNEGGVCLGNRDESDQFCSTSQPIENFVKRTRIPVMTPMQSAELEYLSLMDSLVITPRHLDADDDLDWLLKSKSRESFAERERIPAENDGISCCSSSALFPRANYLQEVDVYALPFTVPF